MTDRRLHGKWGTRGVPHRGWTCVSYEDLGDERDVCGMCEQQRIRFVHYMQHPGYPEVVGAGCECAAKMEADYEAAHARERRHQNVAARRVKWLTRTWRESARGHPFLNTDGFNIVVYPVAGGWGFRVKERLDDQYAGLYGMAMFAEASAAEPRHVVSRRRYPTSEAAKLAAFDALVFLKDA